MTVATGLRPNHYSVLGLRPDAGAEDIERAFRKALSPFQPQVLGGVAAASTAYAVLSDPARRRAYDLANGFARPAPPPPSAAALAPTGWAVAGPKVLRAVPRPAGAAAPATTPFIAASSVGRSPVAERPPTGPAIPAASSATALTDHPSGPVRAPREPDLARNAPRPAPVILGMDGVEDGAIGGRKGLMVLGAVAAMALAGGSLGWIAGSDADEANASGLETPLPKAEPRQLSIITPSEGIGAAAVPAEPQRRVARLASAPRPEMRRANPAPAAAPQPDSAQPPALAGATADSLAPVADTPAPAADLPLPARTIARTIDRIGYSCGSVTGSESSGGGAFVISCSSGQKFRASPRSGRYRFKRIG